MAILRRCSARCLRWQHRLCVAVIGMCALCVASCRSTSRLQKSTTAARVDSSSVTVTAVTEYEPVPMTQARLNLTPTELERLPLMPMDFGKTVADGHLTLKAEPDGQGGIRITATHQGEERKVEKTTTTATNRIRDESATTDERKDTHGRSYKLPAILLVVVLLAVIYWLVKHRTTGN